MNEFLSLHDDELADEDLLDTILDAGLYDTADTKNSVASIPQLLTPLPSDPLTNQCRPSEDVSGNEIIVPQAELEYDWEILNHDELAVMDLTDDVSNSFQTSLQQMDAGDAAIFPRSGSVGPPVDPEQTAIVSGACYVPQNHGQHLRPIVRPAFPQQIHDRSPIVGLSASMVLRTCFRVGEAFNVSCQAARAGRTVIIELYARVSSSWREELGVKQHFLFADLFHNRPPFINGICECWKGAELWDYDSQRFLERGNTERMCRCIGKMKREGNEWKMVVLNIWETSWNDIDHVEGVVCS